MASKSASTLRVSAPAAKPLPAPSFIARSVFFLALASSLGSSVVGCGDDKESEEGDGNSSGNGGTGSMATGNRGGTSANGAAASGGSAGSSSAQGDPREMSRTGLIEADCVAQPNTTVEWVDAQDQCLVECEAGFADCDGQRDNGCETSTADAQACGRCIDACLSDLCQGAAACADVQADLWVVQNGFAEVSDLTVAADGQVLVSMDTSGVTLPLTPLAPVSARALLSLSDGMLAWATAPGDTDFRSSAGTTEAQVVATAAGMYVAETFFGATVGSESFEAEADGEDIVLSLISPAGERLWTRALGLGGSNSVFGLYADSDSNVYLELLTEEEFNYGGVTIDAPLTYSNIFMSFTPAGDFRWAEEANPYTLSPVSGGQYVTDSLLFSDLWHDAQTGGPDDEGIAFETIGAQAILHDAQNNLIVVGETQSSRLSLQGGLPGLNGVESAAGVAAPNARAMFAAKYAPSGELLWRTGWGHSLGHSVLRDVRLAPDGTLYVLATGTARSEIGALTAQELQRAIVARIGADGTQQGAWRLDVDSPDTMALGMSATGELHVGIHYEGAAQLPEPRTGNGVVGGTLVFPPR